MADALGIFDTLRGNQGEAPTDEQAVELLRGLRTVSARPYAHQP